MPHLSIETNIPKEKIPADFLSKATAVIAKSLGKPASYCVVSIVPDVKMSFGGTEEPCALGNLMSIGQLGVEENKKHSKAIGELVQKELGVSPSRMYICFKNEPSSNVGFNLTTFHDILG